LSIAPTDLRTHHPGALAVALRERGLPGARSKTAIVKLRRQRARHRAERAVIPPTLAERLDRRLLARYRAEIVRRGGETSITTDRDRTAVLQVTDRHDGLTLLHVAAWRYYGRKHRPHHATLSYLCGTEHGRPWAVRVPGTLTTVHEAMAWTTPAAVKEARGAGRPVWRQGDVYAIATTLAYDASGTLPPRHVWNPTSRTLTHPEHGRLRLPDPIRFVSQHALAMGRGAGHGHAD
jgi:hypothetical protein